MFSPRRCWRRVWKCPCLVPIGPAVAGGQPLVDPPSLRNILELRRSRANMQTLISFKMQAVFFRNRTRSRELLLILPAALLPRIRLLVGCAPSNTMRTYFADNSSVPGLTSSYPKRPCPTWRCVVGDSPSERTLQVPLKQHPDSERLRTQHEMTLGKFP